MPRTPVTQPFLPRLDIEARARPRAPVLARDLLTREAETALERMRRKRLVKSLQLSLALAADAERTARYLRSQAAALDRVRHDERLEALLAFRRAGKPVAEAVADVERRFRGR